MITYLLFVYSTSLFIRGFLGFRTIDILEFVLRVMMALFLHQNCLSYLIDVWSVDIVEFVPKTSPSKQSYLISLLIVTFVAVILQKASPKNKENISTNKKKPLGMADGQEAEQTFQSKIAMVSLDGICQKKETYHF